MSLSTVSKKYTLGFWAFEIGSPKRQLTFSASTIVLGREGADIQITGDNIAPRHAVIVVHAGNDVEIVSLQEDAPVLVNHKPYLQASLTLGDVITLGGTRLVFAFCSDKESDAFDKTQDDTIWGDLASLSRLFQDIAMREKPRGSQPKEKLAVLLRLWRSGQLERHLLLSPIRAISAGFGDLCEFLVAEQLGLPEMFPLVHQTEQGQSFLGVPRALLHQVLCTEEGETRAADAVFSQMTTSMPDVLLAPIEKGRRMQILLRDGFCLDASVVSVTAPVRSKSRSSEIWAPIVGSTVAHAMLLSLIWAISPEAQTFNLSALDKNQISATAQIAPEKTPQEQIPAMQVRSAAREASAAPAATSMRKSLGLVLSRESGAVQRKTIASEQALQSVIDIGILGALKSSESSTFASVFRGKSDETWFVSQAPGTGYESGVRGVGIGDVFAEQTLAIGPEGSDTPQKRATTASAGFTRTAGGPVSVCQSGCAKPVEPVSFSNGEIHGSLDAAEIRKSIRRGLPGLRACYENGLQRDPSLGGRIKVHFVIGNTGSVVSSQVIEGGLSTEVDSCILKKISMLSFSMPKDAGVVEVRYPFFFQAAGSNSH